MAILYRHFHLWHEDTPIDLALFDWGTLKINSKFLSKIKEWAEKCAKIEKNNNGLFIDKLFEKPKETHLNDNDRAQQFNKARRLIKFYFCKINFIVQSGFNNPLFLKEICTNENLNLICLFIVPLDILSVMARDIKEPLPKHKRQIIIEQKIKNLSDDVKKEWDYAVNLHNERNKHEVRQTPVPNDSHFTQLIVEIKKIYGITSE